MKHHIYILITDELDRMKKGKGIFDDPRQALHDLTAAQAAGQKYYTGCDNIKPDGMCAGHI